MEKVKEMGNSFSKGPVPVVPVKARVNNSEIQESLHGLESQTQAPGFTDRERNR